MSKRTDKRAALERAARELVLESSYDVVIVGGGAAGLAASIAAAEQGARTIILERELECGRTILATGGGRCNFANRTLEPTCYNKPEFVEAVCGEDFLADVLGFFRSSGMAWAEEEGRLYPASFSAASVREVLLTRATRAGVTIACGREVTEVARGCVQTSRETIGAGAIILASGGHTAQLSTLAAVASYPVLCPLAAQGLPFYLLSGKRVRADVRLIRADKVLASEHGEVLFRDFGLSGIVIFNMSRFAEPGDTLVLDLAPELSNSQLNYLFERAQSYAGIVDPAVAVALTGRDLKALSCTITGFADTEHAQVTRGGLACSQFNPNTLMAETEPGLFACGEALDIDGPCGGFNLSWAWKSGLVAGAHAAAWTERL